MMASDRYVRTETLFSAIGSAVVTIVLFVLVFGTAGPVAAWGIGAFVFDCFPQAFFTALICTVLPGFITRSRARAGKLVSLGISTSSGLQVSAAAILRRSLWAGIAAMVLVGPASAAVLHFGGINAIGWWTALGVKIVIAAIVAMIATPFGLRHLFQDLDAEGVGRLVV
ncbi:hypothetical protein [Novosphingobium sp.]|uniref:hypothetical protein n=1 Tax=Novosphingobium sp. TaxID=1874826 RepID=UPI003564B349